MAIRITLYVVFIVGIVIFACLTILKIRKGILEKEELDDYSKQFENGKFYRGKDVEEEDKRELEIKTKDYELKRHKNLIQIGFFGVLAVIMLICTILIPGNIHQVNTGEVAVVRHMGKVVGMREPGVYWDWYFTNDYVMFDTKLKSTEILTQSYTSDAQTVDLDVVIQYQVKTNEADKLAITYGTISNVKYQMETVVLDRMKSVLGKNDAEYTVRNREAVKVNIEQNIMDSINDGNYFVFVPSVNIRDLSFSEVYERAAEERAIANQKMEQAKIEQTQELNKAENDKKIAIAKAQAEAESAQLRAEAEAEVARIKAQADQDVAKIEADTALYAGQKNAAIAIQKLAGINGWSVITITEDVNNTPDNLLDDINTYKVVKYDGDTYVAVTSEELAKGVEKLMEVYKYETWDGKLPVYQMSDNGTIAVVTP